MGILKLHTQVRGRFIDDLSLNLGFSFLLLFVSKNPFQFVSLILFVVQKYLVVLRYAFRDTFK